MATPAVPKAAQSAPNPEIAANPPEMPNVYYAADSAPSVNYLPQQKPAFDTRVIAFMPGQAMNFTNRQFRKVEIHSEYPLRILTGQCHQDYTVQFLCEGDPADLFIVDARLRPIFTTPRANQVTIIVTEF